MLVGVDISNYSGPLTDAQVKAMEANLNFVIIGLQDRGTARAQSIKLAALHQEYYMTDPANAVDWLPNASRVWLDIEPGCLDSDAKIIKALAALCNRRCYHGWYGNATSWQQIAPSLGDRIPGPLWWASWGIEPFSNFTPWANFDSLMVHQVDDKPDRWLPDLAAVGLNADVNFADEALRPSTLL